MFQKLINWRHQIFKTGSFVQTLLCFIFINDCQSQDRNSIWCFGDSAGIEFTFVTNPLPIYTSVNSRGDCASICDSTGVLKLYSFGKIGTGDHVTYIYNGFHQIIQNGDSVLGEGIYSDLVIIPLTQQFYYLFISLTALPFNPGFYYCLIDMSLNGGAGAVVQKNIQLLNVDISDAVQAIKHGNGRDWWVIAKQASVSTITQFNRFHVFLVSPSGISAPITQDLGGVYDPDLCKIIFNSTGSKFIQLGFTGFMHEYDFDRCTGLISNKKVIFNEAPGFSGRYFWEGAYSPNDSLFYATVVWNNATLSDTSRLLQYNLFATDIIGSCDTIYWARDPILLGAVRKAPDNKIYLTSAYNWGGFVYPYPDSVYNTYNMNLGVINDPDVDGIGCNFQPFSFYLGGARTYLGLPNNPNYELGPLIGSGCDTIPVGVHELLPTIKNELLITYVNPWQKIFINAQQIKGSKCKIQIIDASGKVVYHKNSETQPPYFTDEVNIGNLQNGLYVVSLTTEKEVLVGKLVKY